MIYEKKCNDCCHVYPINNFSPSKSNKDGFENKCKNCRNLQRKSNHQNKCKECGSIFATAKKNQAFCSSQCSGKYKRKRVVKECNFCGKDVEVILSKAHKQNIFYCNQQCRTEDLKVKMAGSNNPNFNRVEYECDGCNKTILVIPYKIEKQKYIFCNNNCYKNNIGKFFTGGNNPNYVEEIETKCSVCEKLFKRKPAELKYKKHYCSRQCYMSATERTEINGKIEVSCDNCKKAFKVWASKRQVVKHIYCSKKCRNIHQGKIYRGKNHPSWNAELTIEERITNRKYNDYYEWRKQVYARDIFTCQCCGDNKGGNLVAHHILSYRGNEHARTALENGITLCKTCHKLFHDNFGYGNNDNDQLEMFVDIYNNFGVNGFID